MIQDRTFAWYEKGRSRQAGGVAGLALVALLVVGVAAAWWWKDHESSLATVDEGRLVQVERRDLVKAVLATGRVEPLARVNVMSRASGILKEIYVDEGDVVQKGDILAELDREQLVAQNNENLGSQAAALARLKAARARANEAQVRLDDPELEFARREAQRLEDLFASGSASRNELDDAELRLANVEYRIRQVEANIPVLEAQIAQAEADLMSATASLERSETALLEATIASSVDGIVLVRDREVGDGISSILTAGGNATPVMTLGDTSKMFVMAQVDEVDIGKIHKGMRALIEVDSYRGKNFDGDVVHIAPAGTVDNNGIVTFEVEIEVDDSDRLLRVDMTANTRLVLEDIPGALSLPHKALSRSEDGTWFARRVNRQESPRVEIVGVEIGISDGLITEITGGLAEGDEVELPSEHSTYTG